MKSKINYDKLTKFVKSKNFLIAVGVFALTMISIGVSYASFFAVKTNTNNQTITTGTLKVSYGSKESAINKNNMISMSDEAGMAQSEATVLHIQNTGTLDSTFVLDVGYDMVNYLNTSSTGMLTPLEYIMIAVFEYDSEEGEDYLVSGPISIADLPIYKYNASDSRYNRYSLLFSSVGGTTSGNATRTLKVKMWLSDKALPAASYSYFYVNSEVVAEVENAKMKYNIIGNIKDAKGNNTFGAVVNIQNGSKLESTNSSGNFTISGVYSGVYNLDIIFNGVFYSGNITIEEGNSYTLNSIASSFTLQSNKSIYELANLYGTTIDKIMKKNSVNDISNNLVLTSGQTYNLYPTYKLVGSTDYDMRIAIRLNDDGTFTMTKN